IIMPLKFAPLAKSFLGPDGFLANNPARAVVIPCGLEKSVSYGGGTRKGPRAIIAASRQVELFNEELDSESYLDFGIGTLPEIQLAQNLPKALDQIEKTVSEVLAAEKFPLILGGEHSLTPGAVRAITRKFGRIAILHFDAHADLRDGYLGEKFSHAAAMRRCLDNPQVAKIVSVAIRSISIEESDFLKANSDRIKIFWGKDKLHWKLGKIVAALPKNLPLYLSFDLDALDPSLLPATGTPEPGGMFWDETLAILRTVASQRKIVGADLVELAPQQNLPASDFIAAKLAYKILSYAFVFSKK
ncbi:MAG: agmatinase, partial [Patescibacteria group bacterium]